MIRFIAIVFAIFATGALAAGAPAQATAAGAFDSHAIIEKMLSRNASLHSFEARFTVDGRMLSFPFIGTKLAGTSSFRRPSTYEVDFDHASRYAAPIRNLLVDMGNLAAWEQQRNVAVDAVDHRLNGASVICLRLTRKTDNDELDYALAMVDPRTYELEEMDWHYNNGGTVVVTQTYRTVGEYAVVASMHTDIHFPGIHAVADVTYSDYETNVDIDDKALARSK